MARTWMMRKVTDWDEKASPLKTLDITRLYFVMECGHKRQYGHRDSAGATHIHGGGYGTGSKALGEMARCYDCKRPKEI